VRSPSGVALRQWSERYLFDRGERHSVLIDKRTGKPVPFMAPTAKDGTVLAPAVTEVRKVS
jgi:thiamine biosynthesis lipoprotein ApbE